MELNKSNLKKIRGIIVFTAIVIACFWKYDVVFAILKFAFGILFPFILGGAIAFILNVPMNFIESGTFSGKKKRKIQNNKKNCKTCQPDSGFPFCDWDYQSYNICSGCLSLAKLLQILGRVYKNLFQK